MNNNILDKIISIIQLISAIAAGLMITYIFLQILLPYYGFREGIYSLYNIKDLNIESWLLGWLLFFGWTIIPDGYTGLKPDEYPNFTEKERNLLYNRTVRLEIKSRTHLENNRLALSIYRYGKDNNEWYIKCIEKDPSNPSNYKKGFNLTGEKYYIMGIWDILELSFDQKYYSYKGIIAWLRMDILKRTHYAVKIERFKK